jgi:hypothetical protein
MGGIVSRTEPAAEDVHISDIKVGSSYRDYRGFGKRTPYLGKCRTLRSKRSYKIPKYKSLTGYRLGWDGIKPNPDEDEIDNGHQELRTFYRPCKKQTRKVKK